MNITDRIRSFLEAATAGLKDDRELQMETRSELASHVEAASRDLTAGGLSEEQAADQALKALGPATDIAADFVSANRGRMKLRARLQVAARAFVVPIAVLLALFTFYRATGFFSPALRDGINILPSEIRSPLLIRVGMLGMSHHYSPKLSADKLLILHGDLSCPSRPEQARAIWEAYPANVVYLNNYITVLTTDYGKLDADTGKRLAAYGRELKLAEKAEPDNARFHYLMAGKLLGESSAVIVKNPTGTNRPEEMTLVISNALSFNQAMDELKTALKKPYYRRYGQEMLCARLSIRGDPETRAEQIVQIAQTAGVLSLPDAVLSRP